MATEAQIRANRANALKSTGPRTAEGKRRSSQNNRRHGYRSSAPLPVPEDPAFSALHQALLDDLQPSGPEDQLLVQDVALAHYHLHRLQELEVAALAAIPDPVAALTTMGTFLRYRAPFEHRSRKALRRLAGSATRNETRPNPILNPNAGRAAETDTFEPNL